MWSLVNNSPFVLYIKLGILVALVAFVSFTTYKITVWKETSSNAAKMAAITTEKVALEKQLADRQYALDLYAANSEIILAQAAENKQRITALNVALAKKQKSVAAVKASDCSSAIREIMNVR